MGWKFEALDAIKDETYFPWLIGDIHSTELRCMKIVKEFHQNRIKRKNTFESTICYNLSLKALSSISSTEKAERDPVIA